MIESQHVVSAPCAMAAVILVSIVSSLSSGMVRRCVTESDLTLGLVLGSNSLPASTTQTPVTFALGFMRRELCRFGATRGGKGIGPDRHARLERAQLRRDSDQKL